MSFKIKKKEIEDLKEVKKVVPHPPKKEIKLLIKLPENNAVAEKKLEVVSSYSNKIKVPVVMGGHKRIIELPEKITGEELQKVLEKVSRHSLSNKDIIIHGKNESSEKISGEEEINIKDIYEIEIDEPWVQGNSYLKISWFRENVNILRKIYGHISYNDDYSEIIVHAYPFPKIFTPEFAPVKLETPGLHGNLSYVNGYNFYTTDNVKLKNGTEPSHFFKRAFGWQYISFHTLYFKPNFQEPEKGTTLAHLFKNLADFLSNKEVLYEKN